MAGIGFPEKGTPQGGIISPLLSNIVLNELDWWIVSQWEEMPTQRNYVHRIYANGTPDKSSTIRTLRNYTNLKECYVVRYADDFKIFCKKLPRKVCLCPAIVAARRAGQPQRGHQSGLFELCPILLLGAEPAFFRRQYSRLSECSRPSKYFPV